MSTSTNSDEFYKKLKTQLEETAVFPSLYLYKFIVPTKEDDSKVDMVVTKFDNLGAAIVTKKSKNGKYTSVSIEVKMKSADAVIKKYKEVTVIEGIISL
jgi:putative lipoic acid-binding regulatory protein